MKVRWIADARAVSGFGTCGPGEDYDFPPHVAESLIAQGKAIVLRDPEPVPETPGSSDTETPSLTTRWKG